MSAVATSFFGGIYGPNGAYQGASSTRQAMQAWRTTHGSPDMDVLSNMTTLRSRSRDLVRNVPAAKAALRKKSVHVVNTGIRFKSRLNHEALGITPEQARAYEKKITQTVHRWAKSKNSDATRQNNFYQNTFLVFHSMMESGDVFSMLPFLDRPNAFLDLAIKIVEADLCVPPTMANQTKENAGGVEVDEWGAPTAYYFRENHDQDIEASGIVDEPVRVAAYGEETGRPMVLHVFGVERPGQRRGVPLLAPVIEPLKQLGRYKDAELMAAVVAGMFTVFIKTMTGAPTSAGNVPDAAKVGASQNATNKEPGDYEMSYGGVVDLGEDEEIQTADPSRPNPNYDGFTNSILREIGGALGIGSEMILGFYASSYTAARAAFLDAYAGFKVDVANLVSDFCDPVKNTVLLNAVLRRKLDLPGYLDSPDTRELWEDGIWVSPAPGQLDPVKETQAYKMKVEERFLSRRTAAQKLEGEDLEQVIIETAEEEAWERDAGIVMADASNNYDSTDDNKKTEPGSEDEEILNEEENA